MTPQHVSRQVIMEFHVYADWSFTLQKGGGRGRKSNVEKDKDYYIDEKEKPYGCDSEYLSQALSSYQLYRGSLYNDDHEPCLWNRAWLREQQLVNKQ